MGLKITPTELDGVVIIETEVFRDARGFFTENYHLRRFRENGIDVEFVQDNHSRSQLGVLRGIHYQAGAAPMSKLVRCTLGSILDVAVDLRAGSPRFGRAVTAELSAENLKQMLVPAGFGHAFLVLTDLADVQYKCSAYYTPSEEGVVAWNDPAIGIKWPNPNPQISKRDQGGISLAEYSLKPAFVYGASR